MTKRLAIILFSALALASCIKNDLPKPTVDLYIASLDVEGASGEVILDRSTYTATIPLKEETDIYNVKINSITYGADVLTNINYEADASQIVVSKDLNGKEINLADGNPEIIYLSYFQTYEWKIVATQTINRIWSVDGQIGATEWDLEGLRAIVKRRQDYPLDDVKTIDVRFGPATYDFPAIADMPTNFNNPTKSRTITVTAHNKHQIWELVVVPTEVAIDFEYVAAGANVIWIKAANIDGASIQFAYRKRGSEAWERVKNEWYAADSSNPYNRYEEGFVKAVIRGLEPNTEYEIIGYADEKQSDIKIVTTAPLYQLPNSQMEEWSQLKNDGSTPTDVPGPCWYPFSSIKDMFWATGNPGGTSLGEKYNLTYPAYKSVNPDNVPADSSGDISAYMGSQSVLNMKFAAGNLFVGHYGETLGTNATVFFGQPMTQNIKPVAVRFKIKYSRGGINWITINNKYQAAQNNTEYHIGSKQIRIIGGQPDVAKVFFCLTDWAEPHCVNSADEKTFFDPRTAAGVFGLGYFDSDSNPEMIVEHTDSWHTMTLPIEYSNPEIVPSQLLLTFTCSGYGDYFTGSSESWMYVDDIELLYDLDEQNQPK